MSFKNIGITSIFIFMLLAFTSCNNWDKNYQTVYNPQPAIEKDGFPINNPVFISNIVDARPQQERIPLDPNVSPLLLIPLWPYDHSTTSPVLKYTYMQTDMLNTLKHLIAEDIRTSGIFSYITTQSYGVTGSQEAEYAAKIPDDAYVLEIEIKKALWSRYVTTYCLSYPGSLLWLFAPESYGSVSISIEAKLYSPSDRSKALVQTTISKEVSCTEWSYDQINYQPPISEFKLAEMFPEIMTDLRAFLIKSLDKSKKD
ncbi:MAG: hypothetical protein WCR55_06095 [Lentisphaerota bacterium]